MDDGAYLIAKILVRIARLRDEGKTVDMLIADLAEPLEATEFRFGIKASDFRSYGEKILSDLTEYASLQPGWSIVPENYEGVRISLDRNSGNGWFLLRMSLHDPIMPLNIESNDEGGIRKISAGLAGFLARYADLDITGMKDYI